MLKRQLRLPASVRLVHPKIQSSKTITLKVSLNGLPYNRFGFTMTKRTAKLAVDRNRTKRKIRAQIEAVIDKLVPGYDFLIIIRKNAADDPSDVMTEEITTLLKSGKYFL